MTINMHPSMGLKDSIEQRRAARSFRSDPIPDAALVEILRLGVRAPSGYNLQPWRFVVVRETENKERLKACAFNQRQVSEAPVVLICCGDRRVAEPDYIESVIKLGAEAGAVNEAYADVMRQKIPALFENHPCFQHVEAWTNRHTMLAVAHLMIVAKSYGVDSCPMEGFVSDQVKEAFQIPAEVDVCCLLALGYVAEPFKPYGGRFEIDQVFFGESYEQPLTL
ncbi:nitroreductase family protein [Allocoleopsis franciscana]|uniref:Nitroreductase n=1 Tax=Allocoleopsis franciscana PCC 7113 TaxID=1173027 RepID=K9WM23_9CYAN|nr:nitroreductase family protein [Allocoleopsis franciscana]AFZ20829.1 nitroreductase [Allocoleopsis franciscana PCC 7113]